MFDDIYSSKMSQIFDSRKLLTFPRIRTDIETTRDHSKADQNEERVDKLIV